VVNIQGDEPLLYPELVDGPVDALAQTADVVCTNPVAVIDDEDTFQSGNVVKVVCDVRGRILFMSREPIPSRAHGEPAATRLQQLVVVPFRGAFLQTYCRLEPTPMERAESIDMLRVLEHGFAIQAVVMPRGTIAVDVPSDVPRVERALANDPLSQLYLR